MLGYGINITIENKPDDIRFRLYDNGELAVDDIGEMDFFYPTPEGYSGVHTLTMTYFQTFDPSVESSPKTVFTKNFTLPDLAYQVEVGLLL